MTIATTSNLTMTMEAFLRMPGNEHHEWMHGQAIAMAETPNRHALMINLVNYYLRDYLLDNPIGEAISESAHFRVTLADGTPAIRKPDVSFIAADDPATLWDIYPYEGGPDLAVEVTSQWDRAGAVDEKVRLWLDNGSRVVWVVHHTGEVTVARPGREPITLGKEANLDGEDVLPGFAVEVGKFSR